MRGVGETLLERGSPLAHALDALLQIGALDAKLQPAEEDLRFAGNHHLVGPGCEVRARRTCYRAKRLAARPVWRQFVACDPDGDEDLGRAAVVGRRHDAPAGEPRRKAPRLGGGRANAHADGRLRGHAGSRPWASHGYKLLHIC